MAESTTIARPYAEAAFRLADQSGSLPAWSSMLEGMAQVAAHADMRKLLNDPKLTRAQLAELFASLCKDLNSEGRNFISVLVDNARLGLLPEIRELFEELKNAREGVVEAHIVSAFPLDDAQRSQLVSDLERRFKQRIDATVSIDVGLIGGVKIEVGDQVIDSSVQAKLAAMAAALKA